MVKKDIEEARRTHTDQLMSLSGVLGVGIGELDGRPCITVLVNEDSQALRDQIPGEIDGFPVVIEVTGEFRALSGD